MSVVKPKYDVTPTDTTTTLFSRFPPNTPGIHKVSSVNLSDLVNLPHVAIVCPVDMIDGIRAAEEKYIPNAYSRTLVVIGGTYGSTEIRGMSASKIYVVDKPGISGSVFSSFIVPMAAMKNVQITFVGELIL